MPQDGTKYDWFKNELVGNTANFADLYQNGNMPENFAVKPATEYWNDDEISAPFKQKYGEQEGQKEFNKLYDQSIKRFDEYKKGRFDIASTSTKRMLPTRYGQKLANLGLTEVYNNPQIQIDDVPKDIQGRDIVAGIYSRPEYSFRQGAFDNGVLVDGELQDFNTFRDQDERALVYAVDDKGAPMLHNGKTYLRPLDPTEEKKAHEEYATKFSDYMGFNGLDTPDWYVLKFAPKNIANFAADVLDSGAELFKSIERISMDRDEEPSDTYNSLTDFQNMIGSYLHGSTSDTGQQSWTSVEGIVDGLSQVVLQLGGMYGVAAGTRGLLSVANMASQAGQVRAASVASRMFMGTLAADGLAKNAQTAGLSPKEVAAIHGLSLLGYYKIARLSEWVIGTNPAMQKYVMDSVLKRGLANIQKAVPKGGQLTAKGLFQASKGMVRDLNNAVQRSLVNPSALSGYLAAGATESMEEVSEALMELGIKEAYDRIYQPVFGNTSLANTMQTETDKRFNTDYSTLSSELLQSAVLGFAGGTIGRTFFRGANEKKNYYKYLASGQFTEVKNRLESLHQKGALGDASVNAQGNPVEKGEDSRNDIAYKAILNDLKTAEFTWNSKGLNNAFNTNERKLAAISSADIKDTSIGNDLAEALGEIDTLNEEIKTLQADTENDNTKKVGELQKDIEAQQSEIDAILKGDRVTKYMQEALYKVDLPVTPFKKFYGLNEQSRKKEEAAKTHAENLKKSKNASFDTLDKFPVLTEEVGERLKKEVATKFQPTTNQEGEIEPVYEINEKSQEDYEELIDKKVEQGKNPPSAAAEMRMDFDSDYKGTQSFDNIIQSEKEKEKEFREKGTGVYDNLESLSRMRNNLQARVDQLRKTLEINPDINEAHKKLEDGLEEFMPDVEQSKALRDDYQRYIKEIDSLIATSLDNRMNFDNAVAKANNTIIKNQINELNIAVDQLKALKDDIWQGTLPDEVESDLIAIANTEDINLQQKLVFETQKKIYDYFSDDPQAALDALYEEYGFTDAKPATAQNLFGAALGIDPREDIIKPSALRYLKMIITLDPKTFATHYSTIVQNLPEKESQEKAFTKARHVLSPAQRNNAQEIASFLEDNTEKPQLNMSISENSTVYPVTEGTFFTSWQGSGKTITSAVAAFIRQKISGGKILVVANDTTNHKNMIDTLEGLGANIDKTSITSYDALMSHLKSAKQGEITTIIYDEATLLRADKLYELDLAMRQINSKRDGTKMKAIYVGDKTQIGAGNQEGTADFNIATHAIVQTTSELKFSYRTGNDQINNLLEHVRAITEAKNEGTVFSSKYDMDTLAGSRLEDQDFDRAMGQVMRKLTSEDDYVVIADFDKIGPLRAKYDIPEGRIMTPEQAQGKQWDHVIIDIDTTKTIGRSEDRKKKRLLSAVGRAKKFVLARIDNTTQFEGIGRNMTSVEGQTINVEASISEEARIKAKENEVAMLESLNLEPIAEHSKTGSQETVDIIDAKPEVVVESIETSPLSSKLRASIEGIINKIKEFPAKLGRKSNEAFIMQHSFYSYAETYDEEGNPLSITDTAEILRLKRGLIFPDNDDMDISFSIMVHGSELPSRIITEATQEGGEFDPNDKKFVVYATVYEAGKPKYKISMGALNKPSDFGLSQSDLFNVEIPFSPEQNQKYLASIRTSRDFKNLTEEDKADSVIVAPPSYTTRKFSLKGETMSVEEFKKLNEGMWNFADDLIYLNAKAKDKKKGRAEKQTYLVYSPTLSSSKLNAIIRYDQDRIGDPASDVMIVAVDGGRVMTTEDAFKAIEDYYDLDRDLRPQAINTLPEITESRVDAFFQLVAQDLGLGKFDPEKHSKSFIYNKLNKKRKKGGGKTKTAKILEDALHYGFFDRNPDRKKRKGKLKITKTQKGGRKFTKEPLPPIEEGDLGFSMNRVFHYLISKSKIQGDEKADVGTRRIANQLLNKINNQIFPNGFYFSVKPQEGKTLSYQDKYAIADASIADYNVQNMRHPAMPVHKIKFDFFKDVISNNPAYEVKISTRTDFESLEKAIARKNAETPVTNESVTKSELVINKNIEGNERSPDWELFAADAVNKGNKASMFDIFRLYFNKKPYNHKFERFAEYYSRKIYNSVFKLTGNNPEIIQDKLDAKLKELRKGLIQNGNIVDEAIKEIEETGGELNRKMLLENDGLSEVYYDYVIGKEFDSLLEMKFPYIKKIDGRYEFNSNEYKENQLLDNKETVSHIERGNDLVKMHLFNMPIYNRYLDKSTGEEVLIFKRFADQRILAKIMKLIRDEDITDIVKARAFFGERVSDPDLYSFYKRFLDPEPYEAKNGENSTFERTHSISSLTGQSADIAEDTITGILSFLASGNEAEYARVDLAENELDVRFKNISSNYFRDDLEMAIDAVDDGIVQKVDDDSYTILYGRKNSGRATVNSSGEVTFANGRRSDIGQLLLALNLPGINSKQYEDLWSIKDRGGDDLTGTILFEMMQYLSKPKGKRGGFGKTRRGGLLTDWIAWSDAFQDLKQMDSSFGYTNLAGDKVNLISLSYPMTRTNQRLNNIRKNPDALKNNPFINELLKIDAFLFKEGYKADRNSRANKAMTENEQMDFDFRHLYLKSLLKGDTTTQSVLFNPMVFADKTSDAVIRVSGRFLPVNVNGSIDTKLLKSRAVNAISEYNTEIGTKIVDKFIEAFDEVGVKHSITPVGEGASAQTIKSKLQNINSIVNKLVKNNRKKANLLTRTSLVHQLMYQTDGGSVTGGIKTGFINSLVPADVESQMNEAHKLFKKQYAKRKDIISPSELNEFKRKFGIVADIDQLLDSYFYNHNYVAQSYSTMMVGSIWQYKDGQEFGDQIKRASQLTTNRQKFILRRDGYDPNDHGIKHGRKLGKSSKTAIITDVRVPMSAINYQGINNQPVFDGAAFHNVYAWLQMQESYGNNMGFKVAPTIKPISSYVDETLGHSRFDKYASFLLSPEIISKGQPFIKKMNELMLTSVEFNADQILDLDGNPLIGTRTITEVSDALQSVEAIEDNPPANLYELERVLADKHGLDIESDYMEIARMALDVMVKNGLQDNYLQEVIFDSSVKTGVSNLNSIESFDAIQNVQRLQYLERGNQERGLVLDASHDPSTHEGAFPTQIVSAVLQGNFAVEESNNILRAIAVLGEKERNGLMTQEFAGLAREQLRERINKRGDIGLIHQIVNKAKFSVNNKTVLGQLFSSIASKISDLTVSFKLKGGQQVVAPSYGVFNHPTENRPLRGFDAFKGNKSIKKSKAWERLVDLVDNDESPELIKEAREAVHDLLRTEYTEVQRPEVIIAPTMFKDFNIPAGTDLQDIQAGFNQGLYKGTYEDFKKTLDVIMLRIPGTNKQSFMAAEVVGFAHESENTFYTNLDLLYLQGADQDIDKGNLLTFEADKDGTITIPDSVSQDSEVHHIKNYIVQQFINASNKSDTLMETSMPTSTTTLKDLSKEYMAIEDANIHYMNPFSLSTMFVRGQGGKTNISIHANGLKTYSSVYHSLRKRNGAGVFQYTAQSSELGNQDAKVKGLESPDSVEYFETMSFFSELINAAVDNAKDPILGALGINATTGNLVNALAILGYSPRQVVEFLHNPDVVGVIEEMMAYQEFSTEYKEPLQLNDFARSAAGKNTKSKALKDLVMFSEFADDFGLLGQLLGVNREVPNSPYSYYTYSTNINKYLGDITTLEEFVNMTDRQRENRIKKLQKQIDEVPQLGKTVNILQILNDNENFLSYLRSATLVHEEMAKESTMYKSVFKVTERIAKVLERPANERLYKDVNNFMYGLAVDEFLSQDGGTLISMTGSDGITRQYNLGRVKGAKGTGQLGRIEFMQDFPDYFKHELVPARQDTLQNYMTIETIGKEVKITLPTGEEVIDKENSESVRVLKLIGDFRSQSPEKRVMMMSMMQMLEDGPSNTPDLGIEGDSNVRQMLFYYSLIKDKGGNSQTSYTALFDPEDFAAFDEFLDGWSSGYNINNEADLDDMIEWIAAVYGKNSPKGIKGRLFVSPMHRYAIPYKNDRTFNDTSEIAKDITRLNEAKISNNQQLVAAIKAEADIIYTTIAKSSPKAKVKIEDLLAKGGYELNEEASSEGTFVWEKMTTSANSTNSYFSEYSDSYNVQTNSEMSDLDDDSDTPNNGDVDDTPPLSKADFETAENRRNYARYTNSNVINTIASIISQNTGINVEVMTASQIKTNYGTALSMMKGFVASDGTPIINSDLNDLDTPMHEMGHLWVKALKGSNRDLYNTIIEQSSEHEMMDRVAELYPELEGEALAEEVFSTLFGLSQQDKALSSYNRTFLTRMRDTLNDFLRWLNDLFLDVFGMQPNTDDTLVDIMNKVGDRMLSSSVFNFSNADIQTLGAIGVNVSPISTELRAVQDELVRKGLMETIC